MSNLTFKAVIEHKGKLITKEIEAPTIEDAKKEAKSYGKIISIKKIFALSGRFEMPLEDTDRQIFLQRLAAMIGSNMGMSDALGLMESTFTGKIKKVSSRLLRSITTGSDLAEALDKIGDKDFPPTTVALIKAGISGGNTAIALRNAAEFEIEMDRVKRESAGGIGSALGGFMSAVGITFGTTRFMGPEVLESDLMKIAGDTIDVDWAVKLGIFCEWSMGLFFVSFVGLWALNKFVKPFFPLHVDKIILSIPFYKDLVTAKNSYVALYGLGMLTRSDVRLAEALLLASRVADKGRLRQDLVNAAQAISEGKGNDWAKELSTLHPTDIAALSSSEDRENISRSLDAIAIQYKNIYAARVKMLAPVLQGISVIFLCLSGAVLFGLTMVPMMQFATADLN